MRLVTCLFAFPLAWAAPVLDPRVGQDVVPNRWIVVMKSGTSSAQLASTVSNAEQQPGARQANKVWSFDGFKGFAITGSRDLANSIAKKDAVELIEPDSIVTTQSLVTQSPSTWGLARISHRASYSSGYTYDSSAGRGITVYCIDTGVYTEHSEFEGRASFGASFVAGETGDGNGHGSHVCSTVGGKTYGVAKKTKMIAVKVLSDEGSGAMTQIISGIEWAVNDMKRRKAAGKAVANMSLGGSRSESVDQVIKAATDAGLFIAAAAGNSAQLASLQSPAGAPSACTVGATDEYDNFASFSNYGPAVDVLAPGVGVTGAWIGSPDAINTISGTSMASPHVAGLAAYLLGLEGPRSAVALCTRIKNLSTKKAIYGLNGLNTANRLAYNGDGK